MGRGQASRRAVLLVLLVAVPVVFDTRVEPVFALPKFTVVVLGAFILVVLGVAEAVQSGQGRWRNGLEVPVVFFLAWTAICAAVSRDPGHSVVGARESLHGLVTVAAFVVVFFTVAEAFDRAGVRTALAVLWFAGGGAVLLYGALQLGGEGGWDPVPWLNRPTRGVIWSTLGNPNVLAGFLAMILPAGLAVLLVARARTVRGVAALMVALLIVELGVTLSRGALLATAAGVIAFFAWRARKGQYVLTVICAVLLAVVVGGAADVLRADAGTTVDQRVELWRTALQVAREHPVTGVGPDGFANAFDAHKSREFVRVYGPDLLATDAHNLFLTVLATSGVPGLVAFMSVVAGALLRLARLSDPLAAAVAAALIAYLVQASFNRQDIALDFCFWFLLGLSCGLSERWRDHGARRPRARAARATTAARAATASATHEMTASLSPPSDSTSAATSRMSLHQSWRSVSAESLIVRRTAQPRAAPGENRAPS